MTFEIKEEFYLNDEPFRIWSGAIHYFRVHPTDWHHSLYNLKALGFNTVETYIPWNMHEHHEKEFDFEGILDLKNFIRTAEEVGLYVIVRPTPYICAEWDFGGLPYWLLNKNDIKIRTSDNHYLHYVKRYFTELFKILIPQQISQGGPIIMMQVENEYGSFGEEKAYVKAIKDIMVELGVTVPMFTSDGAWEATLRAGSLIDGDLLPTGNFGSRGAENFKNLQKFHEEHNKKFPLMCMEFWGGWFNRWKEPIVTRETDELILSMKEVMQLGSINLYMFHGGTNFGFMNGCSARGQVDLPQITSYDYGAPLDEQGNPTTKYFAMQQMIKETFPETKQLMPLIKEATAFGSIHLTEKVSLFSIVDQITKVSETTYPLNMEKLKQGYGYLLYRTSYSKDAEEEKFRIIDGRDRALFYMNEKHIVTQYQNEIGEEIVVPIHQEHNQIDILMENMGRVNYGHKLLADTQQKGLRQGVMADLHFMTQWKQYSIDFEDQSFIDFSKEWLPETPSFYKFNFELADVDVKDSYINLTEFGKGIVLLNGVNLGRFWDVGPTLSLYAPKGYFKEGCNQLIIFETEGIYAEQISLSDKPLFINS